MKINRNDDRLTAMSEAFFRTVDQDRNGTLTKDAMQASAPAHGSAPVGAPRLDDLFAEIDSNGDNAIDLDEHNAFASQMASARQRAPSPEALADKLLSKTDTDGDGAVSKDDLLSALPSRFDSHMLDDLFADADQDGDGKVTGDDLKMAITNQLSKEVQYRREGDLSRTSFGPRPLGTA